MRETFKTFIQDESGASAAEYALILAIVGAGIAAAATSLGGEIANALGRAETAIKGVNP